MDVAAGDEDVERLRRVAYGRGAGAAERAEAEAALRALAERPADAGDAARAEPAADGEVLAALENSAVERHVAHDDGGEVSTPIWERRIRVGWVVPLVAGAIVVGALGALQVTGQFGRTSQSEGPHTISPTDPPPEGWIQMPGDLQAADAWFDGSANASDAYPFENLLESNGIDPYDVRFALAGGGGWNVWVGRSADRRLCLLIADAASESGAAGCFERARFAINGAHLGMGGRTAHWFGAAVMTSPTSGGLNEP